MSDTNSSSTDGELKRLGFVGVYSSSAAAKASSLYATTRGFVPRQLDSTLSYVEQHVQSIADIAAEKGDKVLHDVDNKVDHALVSVGTYVHDKNLELFLSAKTRYLDKVTEVLKEAKAQGLSGAARTAADVVHARVQDVRTSLNLPHFAQAQAALLSRVHDAWGTFTSLVKDNKLLETAKPAVDKAWEAYLFGHDILVGSPAYRAIYGWSSGVTQFAQETPLYKIASKRLYPYVSPYVDPVINSDHFNLLLEHWKPTTAPKVASKKNNGVSH